MTSTEKLQQTRALHEDLRSLINVAQMAEKHWNNEGVRTASLNAVKAAAEGIVSRIQEYSKRDEGR